nr:hypothetical protein BaRGS_010836 [Batillaria attramentaria]
MWTSTASSIEVMGVEEERQDTRKWACLWELAALSCFKREGRELLTGNLASQEDADDADTESSTEQDEDDRIESEQSDDANSAPPDDQDQPDLSSVDDIGDLPLVPGAVERHYIHHDNQQLNLKLNCVVVTVILVVFGLGLGHWIGERFPTLKVIAGKD